MRVVQGPNMELCCFLKERVHHLKLYSLLLIRNYASLGSKRINITIKKYSFQKKNFTKLSAMPVF